MTTNFCRHCGEPLVAGAAFCGGCGRAVEATVSAEPWPLAPTPSPALPPRPALPPPPGYPAVVARSGPDHDHRRLAPALLVGVLAIVVMVAVGTGTAYLLTRGDATPTAGAAGTSDDPYDDADDERINVPSEDPVATVTVTEGTAADPTTGSTTGSTTGTVDPETRLRDIVAGDRARAEALVGSWVPQLASISGQINGSWAAALAEYEELAGFYPDVVLVDAADWPHSFIRSPTYDEVLVALSPTPASATSAPVLDWCRLNRGDRQASCYAKLLETSGSPRNNSDQNDPEPEYN